MFYIYIFLVLGVMGDDVLQKKVVTRNSGKEVCSVAWIDGHFQVGPFKLQNTLENYWLYSPD